MSKDEGFQPPTQGPIFGDGDVDQTGQYAVDEALTVPDGSVSDVVRWVGDDKTRAEAALKAENAKKGEARTSLVEQLEKLAKD